MAGHMTHYNTSLSLVLKEEFLALLDRVGGRRDSVTDSPLRLENLVVVATLTRRYE